MTGQMLCERPAPPKAAALADRLAAELPALETARLRLRAPRLADFAAYADIVCGPRGEGLGGPMAHGEAWYDFSNMVGCWLLRGHGLWSIEPRGGGDLLGFVVLGCEPGDEEHELGFLLTEAAEGHGYATEAAQAARAFARDTLGLPSLVSYIVPQNARSIALAQRLGATPAGDGRPGSHAGTAVFRHDLNKAEG
ncbi:GNAT family N-acetyltransferase [Roseovarius aestuariivivens]|uniref:GNAT family N-acetyltransferase n=1 Tax=Roseovarius aestuariivivens TaxID=1888910 RepID=UPI001FD9AC9B|nr:GNAT family protein [Roseovarius aestuariivivens]